ncbi:MAG TPA: type III polyketide synthase [Candidatus Latescibacteria bacterium]|nr:type III polyketide synthase [Candidatus Latescibacterota bacterium]
MSGGTTSGLWGPVTAVPGPGMSKAQTLAFLTECLDLPPRRAAWLGAVMDVAGIERRYTCVEEFYQHVSGDAATTSAAAHWESVLGGLEGRMARYVKASAQLSEEAARAALQLAELPPEEVTHLVFVTCTGFENPGPDAELANRLRLPDTVHRLQVGFMGCQASIQGLRLADAICRSEPKAVVLLVCVELGTLHFDPSRTDREHLVISSLFGDGSGAALITRRSLAVAPDLRLLKFTSRRVPAGAELLSWRLGEPAFNMGLGRELPEVVRREVCDFVRDLVPPATPKARLGWAIHPGGRAVLDAVQESLELSDEQLAPSRHVLSAYGNMSSPTLLFVLAELPLEQRSGVALAFGPGLSLEGFGWSRPSRSSRR